MTYNQVTSSNLSAMVTGGIVGSAISNIDFENSSDSSLIPESIIFSNNNNLNYFNLQYSDNLPEESITSTHTVDENNLPPPLRKPNHKAKVITATIQTLSEKLAGWKGEASLAATSSATHDAYEIVRKLITFSVMMPDVGLEEEGTFTFYWNTDNLIASLSLESDRTYSFYGENKHTDRELGLSDQGIDQPFTPELLKLLAIA